MCATGDDVVALHGWTAVDRGPQAPFAGKPYIHEPGPLLVEDIPFPSDGPVAAKVQEYAEERLPRQTYHHSMRVCYFAVPLVAPLALHPGPQLATLHDNAGAHPELVHPATRRGAARAWPREGWSACFAAVVREENRLKPWAHTTALGEEAFPASVLGNELMREWDWGGLP